MTCGRCQVKDELIADLRRTVAVLEERLRAHKRELARLPSSEDEELIFQDLERRSAPPPYMVDDQEKSLIRYMRRLALRQTAQILAELRRAP